MSDRRSETLATKASKKTAPLRVLCLSHYYPPETGALAARMSETAEAWVRRGAQVCVVTCAPNYPKGKVFSGYRNALFQSECIRGVDVIRVGTFIAANEGFFFRTLGYVSFAVSATVADGSGFREKHGLGGKFVCAYVGTHGMAHRLETVLRAASLLKARRDIAILMVGDGAERDRLVAMKDAMGLSNVTMLGQLPREKMPSVMAATDASLVVLSRNPLFRSVIPSKIFEAMAMRRPIILGVEGESRQILEGAGAGIAVEPENAEALAAAIEKLADDPALCRSMGEAGRSCVEREFDREKLAGRLLEELEALRDKRAEPVGTAPDMRIVQ